MADPLRPAGDPEYRPDADLSERALASYGPRKTDVPLQVAAEPNPTMDTSFDEFAGFFARAEAEFLAGRSDNYESYREAFRFGWSAAGNPEWKNRSWSLAEDAVRQHWSRDHDNWDAFAESVRSGWDERRGMEDSESK